MENSILDKLDFLEKWILQVDSNVKFNMSMQWALLGVVVSIVGVALVIIAKTWFQDRLDKELKKYKDEVINEVTNFKTVSTVQNSSICSHPVRISHNSRINAILLKCYVVGEYEFIKCKIMKDFLMYTKNGTNSDKIMITFSNGATIEVKVKGLVEDGFDIDWIKKGEVDNIYIGLDMMIF